MNLAKKITQIFSLILLSLLLVSCEDGCVEADQFDSVTAVIESKPIRDGIYGTYDQVTGGQRADWHDTGLKSNGDRFLIQVSGAWTPWNAEEMNETALKNLPSCNFCAKKLGVPNCICYKNQASAPALDSKDEPRKDVDCTKYSDQNDPEKCICTKDPQYGDATQYGVYHFPLDVLEKNESEKIADRQNQCKYDKGIGAYIGLFGRRGVEVPVRAYHLFSEEEACNIVRDRNGRCIDPNGKDLTRYIFKSANNRIFMKDDLNGNNGPDNNSSDDVYHEHSESVKVLIYDRYYSDNYGQYNITLLKGVGDNNDPGLLEYLVRMVEDVVLGEVNDEDKREGGILEFLYKSIVQDSGFILIVQISLSLYIALFGAAHLFGIIETITKKELMTRALKIGLIVFFTSKDSWYWYNKIVVAFFKDSMDYVVAMIMDLSDSNIDDSSMLKVAQLDRENNVSSSTRFSYVDLTIKKLLSLGTAKKVFGLFFTNLFGFLYIPLIYSLIGFFIYVMLYVASIYIVNVLKIVFVLALGPIFICFTLFSHTVGMFRSWLGFLGSRSLEIIILFAVLYNFLMLIDKNFTALLSYRSCTVSRSLGLFSVKILESESSRTFIEWMILLVIIAGLIFIMKLVIDKVGSLASSMFSIQVAGGKGGAGGSGFGMASGMMGAALSLGAKGMSTLGDGVKTAGSYGISGATTLARKTGLADSWNKLGDAIGVRGPRTRYRDSIIDGAIKAAQSKAGGKTGAERDAFVRGEATKALQLEMHMNPNRMAFAGVDMTNIARRLDQKLVEEPLRQALKDKAKEFKNRDTDKIPLGKEMRQELRQAAKDWLEKNSSATVDINGKSKADNYFAQSSFKDLIRSESEMSSSQAARRFAGNPELQNKYLQHLKDNEARRERKKAEAKGLARVGNMLSRGYHNVMRDAENNPKMMQENFMRKAGYEEQRTDGLIGSLGINTAKGFNPLKRINVFDKMLSRKSIAAKTEAATRDIMLGQLSGDRGLEKPAPEKLAEAVRSSATKADEQKARKAHHQALKASKKRDYFQNQLREAAVKDLAPKMAAIRKLEKKGRIAEAHRAKAELIKSALGDLNRTNSKTLFEKTARLSYLQRQFGIGGEDAQVALSRVIRDNNTARAAEIEKSLSDGLITPEQAKKDLKSLQSNLFDTKMSTEFGGAATAGGAQAVSAALASHTRALESFAQGRPQAMVSDDGRKKAEANDEANKNMNQDRLDGVKKSEELKKKIEEQEKKDKEAKDKKIADDKKAKEEREARVAREKSERDAKEKREKEEREAREAREKSERETREAREKEEREAREKKIQDARAELANQATSEDRKKELTDRIATTEREEREAREKKAKEECEARDKKTQEALKELATTTSEDRKKELLAQLKAEQEKREKEQNEDRDKKAQAARDELARLNAAAVPATPETDARKKELADQIENAARKKAEEEGKAKEKEEREARTKDLEALRLKESTATLSPEDLARKATLEAQAKSDQEKDREKREREERESREKVQAAVREIVALDPASAVPPVPVIPTAPVAPTAPPAPLTPAELERKNELVAQVKRELDGAENHHVIASETAKEKIVSKADEIEARLQAVLNNPTATAEEKKAAIEAAKVETAEAKKETTGPGLVATGFKIEFGSSIADALLKAPNIGLSAGNPLLGVADVKEGTVDQAAANALSIDKNQVSGKLKMSKLDRKVKQFELEQLTHSAENADKISALQKEITDLDKEISGYDNQVTKIEADLKIAMGGA